MKALNDLFAQKCRETPQKSFRVIITLSENVENLLPVLSVVHEPHHIHELGMITGWLKGKEVLEISQLDQVLEIIEDHEVGINRTWT